MEIDFRFDYVWFCFISLFGFTLVIRFLILKITEILQFFVIKKMMSELNMSCQTLSDLYKPILTQI